MPREKKIKISITSGDQDGIGPEVTAKALLKVGPQKDTHFYLWRSAVFGNSNLHKIDRKFKRVTVNSWPEALKVPLSSPKILIDICSLTPPPLWVETSAKAALLGSLDALVTAPLSKTLIAESGLKDLGHTDILSRVCGRNKLFMTFLGRKFHLLLVTGHLPLAKVSSHLSIDLLQSALRAANSLVRFLEPKNKSPQIALLGLNPHAGEMGLIGLEEKTLFGPALDSLPDLTIEGPLVPDAAFVNLKRKKVSIYVAPYHDQGLIPFKMVHDRSGCHLTMGLPFLRTSVDHGTAKDIFGKNKADSSSMQEALKRAIVLSRLSFRPDSY
jgi:4-hydroxythreonine-4-phosphate dehydrogenase